MIVQCMLCGIRQKLPIWDAIAEQDKVNPGHHAYLCPACRARCEADAQGALPWLHEGRPAGADILAPGVRVHAHPVGRVPTAPGRKEG